MKLQKGYYKATNNWFQTIQLEDEEKGFMVDLTGTRYDFLFKYGDFGEAKDAIKEKTGVDNYNVEMKMVYDETSALGEGFREWIEKYSEPGVISENGEKIVSNSGMGMGVVELEKITEEEFIFIENDNDPIEAPPGPYTIQPDVPGKILWLSGAPGMGKSTSAQIMAREDGYVYYEADCFSNLKNPYLPLDLDEPSMGQMKQKNLKGPGLKERGEIVKAGQQVFGEIMMEKDYDKGVFNKYYETMSADIRNEKKRIGGTFAIAHVVLSREARDTVRKVLGSDVVFILLRMSTEDRRKRVLSRHDGSESAADMMDRFERLCEPAQEGEPNTVDVDIKAEMTRAEVVAEIKRKLKELEESQSVKGGRFNKGFYKATNAWYQLMKMESATKGSITDPTGTDYFFEFSYGDWGEAMDEIKEKSGFSRYNVHLKMDWGDMDEGFKEMAEKFSEVGVVSEDGDKCFIRNGMGMGDTVLERITEEEAIAIENDYDPIDAPPGPYTIQPDVPGKILWFSGAPGMGKSTSAQILARNDGYVYYEADCFASLKNPYVPLDAEDPSLAQIKQRLLKGPGVKERSEMAKTAGSMFGNIIAGKEYDKEGAKKYYEAMATDIRNEKKRIGGNFSIAHVLLTREMRDNVRRILGPDVIFILLRMSAEDRRKRVLMRHKGDENVTQMMDMFEGLCEPAQDGELNTIDMDVTADMTREEVVAEVKKKVKAMEDNQMKLLDGYYKVNESVFVTWKVDGDKIECKDAYDTYDYKPILQYGDFGEASDKVKEASGKQRYNMNITYFFAMGEKDENGEIKMIPFNDYGVIVEGGKKVHLKGMAPLFSADKITDEEFAALENAYDDIEQPPGPYTVQPQNQGKIVWLTGAPGSGKSTTAQLLGRLHGYVYYEADCFASMKNPFVDLNSENPTMDQMKQNFLKGKGAAERSAMIKGCSETWGKVMAGDFDENTNKVLIEYYGAMCEDIKALKKRIGGNWAIATVVLNTVVLQKMREVLGDDLICIHLQLDREVKMKRLLERHEGGGKLVDMIEAVEKQMDFTENDTQFVYSKVSGDMSREDVVNMVLETVKKNVDNASNVGQYDAKKKSQSRITLKTRCTDCKYCFM